ncbi:hypothetical protein JMJ77_0008810 [Colletotrichum scovillei]|uniref:Uncharacterized protein n=1 Tax=Colletotrichum scovillei TaxID=1209932 RepID=A0A9P7QQF0_9PEZI|nr:hypothetical protein JMJ78_0001666 [Colletotrichum scovillei]KAG7041105.1 hypothetical protein JMJ77_0008810 [Colletotrichum scovillei]KAG7061138.1 hypothetical protein JMJ76_0010208 [Colletotrichum scovillei]
MSHLWRSMGRLISLFMIVRFHQERHTRRS